MSDLEIHAAEIQRVRAQMEEILARHTGHRPEQVRTDIERDKILTAQECKAYGIVDEVIQSRKLNARRSDAWAEGARVASSARTAAGAPAKSSEGHGAPAGQKWDGPQNRVSHCPGTSVARVTVFESPIPGR